jgi:hypothetical protein
MPASNSVLGGPGGYFGDEARITMHFSQRILPCGSIIQRRAMQMGRPSGGKKLLTAKIAKISRRSQSRDLFERGELRTSIGGIAYLFSIGTYFDG